MGTASKGWGVALALCVPLAVGCGRIGYDVDRAADAAPGPDVGVRGDAAVDALAGDTGLRDAAILDAATGDSGMLDSGTIGDAAPTDAPAPKGSRPLRYGRRRAHRSSAPSSRSQNS